MAGLIIPVTLVTQQESHLDTYRERTLRLFHFKCKLINIRGWHRHAHVHSENTLCYTSHSLTFLYPITALVPTTLM